MASMVLENGLRPAYTSGKAVSESYTQMVARWSIRTEESHQETLQVVEEAKQQTAARALQDQKLEMLVKALYKDRAERKAECAALLDAATKAAVADQAEMMCLRQHIAQQDEEIEDLKAQIAQVSRQAHMQAFKMVSARQQREAAHRRKQAEKEAMLRQMRDENNTLGRELERLQVLMDDMKAEHAAILEGVLFTQNKADWLWEECCGNGEQGEQGEQVGQDEQDGQAAEQQLVKMQQALEQQLAEVREACAQEVAEVCSAAEQQLQQAHEAAEQQLAAERSAAEQRMAEAHRAAEQRVAEVQQAALQRAEELRVLRLAAAQQAGSHGGHGATSNLQAYEGAAETHLHPSCAGKMTGKDQQQVGKLLLQQALKAALAPQRSAGSNSSSSDGEEPDSENSSGTTSASSSQQGWGGWGSSSSNSSPLYISRSNSSCRPRWCIDWANLPVPCDGWGSVRYSWKDVPVPCDGW